MGDPVADCLRQVLDQRAAQRHIQNLHAAADAQGRHPGLDRTTRQVKLKGVALVVDHVYGLVVGAAVVRGIQIAPTGQHEPVYAATQDSADTLVPYRGNKTGTPPARRMASV